jgi:O-antigen/teichoic acid export membrane protein
VREVARYGAAVRLVDGLNWLPVAVGTVLLPALSRLRADDPERTRRLIRQGYRFLALGIFPAAALGTLAGGFILATLFGPSFRSAGGAFAVLLWAHFFAASWVLARQVLVAEDRGGYLSLLALIAGVVNVGLNFWLIPEYGALGAAWASLVAYASPFAAAAFLPVVRAAFLPAFNGAVRALAASCVILAGLYPLRHQHLQLFVAFAVAMPVALVVSRATTVSELRQLVAGLHSRSR